jgi:phage gpG-like protein
MNVEFVDNSDKVLEAFKKQVYLALESVGMTAEGYAKEDCPVDTGRLRNSISHVVDEEGAYIGTNVEYAEYVEYGDTVKHQNGKAHFLRDAATMHGEEYKNIFERIMKD